MSANLSRTFRVLKFLLYPCQDEIQKPPTVKLGNRCGIRLVFFGRSKSWPKGVERAQAAFEHFTQRLTEAEKKAGTLSIGTIWRVEPVGNDGSSCGRDSRDREP